MSPAEDLRTYLVATVGGATHTAATTFYGATTPVLPDELTALRDTPGFTPQDFFGDASVLEFCGVQAIIRATTEVAGLTRAWAVYNDLRRIDNVVINTRRFTMVQAVSPPQHLGLDDADITGGGSDGRRLWSINFLAWRAR